MTYAGCVRKLLLPVIAVVLGIVQVWALLDTKAESAYVPVAGTSTTTTLVPGSAVKAPWGRVVSESIRPPAINTCTNVMVDVQIDDMAPIGDPNKFVELKGVSGYLFAVRGMTLQSGTNPVVFSVCSRQQEEWRATIKAPWGNQDFTLKSYPKCSHVISETLVEGQTLVLSSFCPSPTD